MLCDNLDYGLTVIPLKQCKCHSHNSMGRKVENVGRLVEEGGRRERARGEGEREERGETVVPLKQCKCHRVRRKVERLGVSALSFGTRAGP